MATLHDRAILGNITQRTVPGLQREPSNKGPLRPVAPIAAPVRRYSSSGRGSVGSHAFEVVAPTVAGTATVDPASPFVDRRHAHDRHHESEYIKDIVEYFRIREKALGKDAGYLRRQNDVNEKMRLILTDWLVDVHLKFKLKTETLFLAVDLVDRYLSIKMETRTTLQLVGIVAMLIAAKYEEIYPPQLKDCVYICANTYNNEEVLRMERNVMSALNYKVCVPTLFPFLARYLDTINAYAADPQLRHMAFFFAEMSLMSYSMIKHVPSMVASSALYLALVTLGRSEGWNPTLEHYSEYSAADILECSRELLTFARTIPTSKYQAIIRKYSHGKYMEVAKIPMPESLSC